MQEMKATLKDAKNPAAAMTESGVTLSVELCPRHQVALGCWLSSMFAAPSWLTIPAILSEWLTQKVDVTSACGCSMTLTPSIPTSTLQ
jgi:hypothetical protein